MMRSRIKAQRPRTLTRASFFVVRRNVPERTNDLLGRVVSMPTQTAFVCGNLEQGSPGLDHWAWDLNRSPVFE